MLQVGDSAPLFTLSQVDGKPISLKDVIERPSRPLLIFLRYLG